MSKKYSLGILDWGIGGISIHKLIKDTIGSIPIVYLSDTGATPYGRMKRAELALRLDSAVEFLKGFGVSHLVIGCNAASTALPLIKAYDITLEGMIGSAVASTLKRRPADLGLIGGRQTVISGVYRSAFLDERIRVKQRIAQPLSGLIESGDVSSDNLNAECSRILRPLKDCSHILLACTHYPAILPILRRFVSSETVFIDPAPQLVDRVTKWGLSPGGEDLYLTTGDPENMRRSARAAFSWQIGSVRKVVI
jgi:glutamate racemase